MADEIRPEDESPGTVGEPEDTAPAIDLPEDPVEAIPVLIGLLADSQAALETRTDDLQRVAAEFENFRKRAQRDRDEIVTRSSQRLVESLLPVLDTFDSAFLHEPTTPGEEAMLAGMRSTYRQLMDVLAQEGLTVIPTVGEPFDPAVHEAVMGGGDGHLVVASEMRRGYTLSDRVLRPAMVQVAEDGEDED